MTKRFLSYLTRELPGLPDSKPLNPTDTWPAAFQKDQEYLYIAVLNLEKEIQQVHETVCNNPKERKISQHKCYS